MTVWRAWTDPSQLERWWVPAPPWPASIGSGRPGGALVTRMSDDGVDFVPHLDALFLVVDELERLAFTNAIDSRWRPAYPELIAMSPRSSSPTTRRGTDYRVVVRHGDPAARARHEQIGFFDGWGSVTEQLTTLVEQAAQCAACPATSA